MSALRRLPRAARATRSPAAPRGRARARSPGTRTCSVRRVPRAAPGRGERSSSCSRACPSRAARATRRARARAARPRARGPPWTACSSSTAWRRRRSCRAPARGARRRPRRRGRGAAPGAPARARALPTAPGRLAERVLAGLAPARGLRPVARVRGLRLLAAAAAALALLRGPAGAPSRPPPSAPRRRPARRASPPPRKASPIRSCCAPSTSWSAGTCSPTRTSRRCSPALDPVEEELLDIAYAEEDG